MSKSYSPVILVIRRLLIISILLISSSVYADPNDAIPTLYTIKIYYESSPRLKEISYNLTLPKSEYYSYYKGTDLPAWKIVKDNVMNDTFTNGGLVTIRIHSNSRAIDNNQVDRNNNASLTLIDQKNARVIWKAGINFNSDKNTINVSKIINNKKYYHTQLNNSDPKILWLEPGVK